MKHVTISAPLFFIVLMLLKMTESKFSLARTSSTTTATNKALSSSDQNTIDKLLFRDACMRTSFLAVRNVCEKLFPICTQCDTCQKCDDSSTPCPLCPAVPIKHSNTFCQDYSTSTDTGKVVVPQAMTAASTSCPFLIVAPQDKSVIVQCLASVENPQLGSFLIQGLSRSNGLVNLVNAVEVSFSGPTVIFINANGNPKATGECNWKVQ